MKIVIPGGSGHLGTVLARAFQGAGHEVVVLSRASVSQSDSGNSSLPAGDSCDGAKVGGSNNVSKPPWRVVAWDGENLGDWAAELEGADALINLAGRTVNCRYHTENRRQIFDSRLKSTKVLGEAVARAARPPGVWLQASTATIYAHRYDAANDEATGIIGGGEPKLPDTWKFSYEVAKSWERVFNEASTPRTRKVALRTSILMSPMRGQAFDLLLTLVRFGLGGQTGNGRQYMSWIHDRDFVRAISWLIEHGEISGPVNLAAPNPLPNADFMRALRHAWGMPVGLPAAKWMLEIAMFFLRTESELVLKSRDVVPGRLTQAGFKFEYPAWPEAARDLCARWRAERRQAG